MTARYSAAAAITSLLALSGCGQADDSFNEPFIEEFIASCTAEFNVPGLDASIGEDICTCGANTAASELTMTEKMGGDTSKLDGIMERCVNEAMADSGETAETEAQ